ncbi:MAG: acetyl-CoA C-acyltransferase [Gammaproteobacteria bacterium]|nr:acetyl-CoA C-acyltransferase [Gammaproteobacteria bacterium]
MQDQDVYIVKAKRSPVCKAYKGGLASVRPDDLLAHVLKGLLESVNYGSDELNIEDVIIGCAMPEAEQGMNVARIATLLAGYAESIPAMTVNRFCSSGLQTIALAAHQIASGNANVVVAGGVESMSMIPLGGYNYRANPNIFHDEHIGIAYGMGITAEIVADKWKISREQQDQFAYNSHLKAINAIKNNVYLEEILPYNVNLKYLSGLSLNSKETLVSIDDGPREDTSLEKLLKLPSVFKLNGTVTAGNSSQMSDGAAALLLMSKKALNKYNLKPLAKFRGFSVAGVPPETMGIGPIAAIPKCLKQCNLKLDDIDVIELNEAFAAQSLAVIDELCLDTNKVNPNGGAIALGHPLGATGAIKACSLIHYMQRQSLKLGMVTMCIGTGMGAAGVFELI